MLDLIEDRVPRGIHMQNLCKHILICGKPGGGKTTAMFSILLQLFVRGVCFVVIEAAKTEYRLLKSLRASADPAAKGLSEAMRIYTPGEDRISPFRFNPFLRPKAVDPDEHIDLILRCFEASLPMFEPLPALLAESLELVYQEHPDPDEPPVMDDLYEAAQRILAGKRYSDSVRDDLSGALEVRMGMLTRRTVGRILRSTVCIPDIADLTASYSVLELDPLETEIKCLLTLFLLTSLHQYIRAHPYAGTATNSNPRFVIVIEEAHHIVGRGTSGPTVENCADPKARASELVCRMLAEFRALRIPLILVDQFPSQVAPQVMKCTGTTLAFNQTEREERETIADAMLFGDQDYEELARLLPGQAYLFAEGYHRAHRIRTSDVGAQLNFPVPPDRDRVLALVRNDCWFQEEQARRVLDVLTRFSSATIRYRREMEQTYSQIRHLFEQRPIPAAGSGATARLEACRDLAATLQTTCGRTDAIFQGLERGIVVEAQSLIIPADRRWAHLESERQCLLQSFEEDIRPKARRLQEYVDGQVALLRQGVFQKEEL